MKTGAELNEEVEEISSRVNRIYEVMKENIRVSTLSQSNKNDIMILIEKYKQQYLSMLMKTIQLKRCDTVIASLTLYMGEYKRMPYVKTLSNISHAEESLYTQLIQHYNILSVFILEVKDTNDQAKLIKVQKAVAMFMSVFKTSISVLVGIDKTRRARLLGLDKGIFPIITSTSGYSYEEELEKLIDETHVDDFMSVNKLLEFLDKVKDMQTFGTGLLDERAVCGDIGGKKVAGGICIEIIKDCLQGDLSKCLLKFNTLDLDNGIDLKTMDYGVALHLAKKIGFADTSVDNAITQIKTANPNFTLTDKLIFLFYAIKARITDVTLKTYTTTPNTLRIREVPKRDVTERSTIGLGQHGGGGDKNMDYYNKFIINVDALKSNLVMKGGSNSVVLKQNIHYLTTLLQNHNKQIEPNDLNKINRLIDSITIGEEKLKQIKGVIDGLITAIHIKKIDLNDNTQTSLPYSMLEDLKNKANDRQEKNLQKVSTCMGIFDYMAPTLGGLILHR